MKLFTDHQYQKLIENGKNQDKDHPPVAKLFLPLTGCQWLLSEINPDEPDIAFGLCDLGMGFPELGYVSLSEIQSVNILPFPLTNDMEFKPTYPMSVYCCAARINSVITTEETLLLQCAGKLKKSKLQP